MADQQLAHQPHQTRAYHKKSRTGCITCKVRKLRCDEQKPSCKRCVSTGRTCDGYTAPTAAVGARSSGPRQISTVTSTAQPCPAASSSLPFTTAPVSATTSLKLALPRSNLDEVRSYCFFLEVAAPSLAGVFDTDFWLGEVPRACHADPAIWHAVVSLGTVYEIYTSQPHSKGNPREIFALQQFNSSIRRLTDASSHGADKWRALTASTIFTCICSIQGLHQQALMHLKAGCSLLKEIERDETKSRRGTPTSAAANRPGRVRHLVNPTSPISPISTAPLRAILKNFETQARAMQNGGIASEMTLLAETDHFSVWRLYMAPCTAADIDPSTSTSKRRLVRYATRDNLISANRAAESLLGGLAVFSQLHAGDVAALVTGKSPEKLDFLIARQEPFTRCFVELNTALRVFSQELGPLASPGSTSEKIRLRPDMNKALLTLALFHATNRILLYRDPDMPDQVQRSQNLASQYSGIVDLAEHILRIDTGRRAAFTPTPSTTQPLFAIIHSGFPQATRRRALALLRRYPRREGLWDTVFAAGLADAIMAKERASMGLGPAQGGDGSSGAAPSQDDSGGGTQSDDPEVPLRSRIYNTPIRFGGARTAIIQLRTWGEWLDGVAGQESVLTW